MNAEPAIYEIRLKGSLSLRWAHRLEGMEITHLPNGDTLLTGALPDQAALYSVLTQLRNIGIPLLEVRQCNEGEPENNATRES
jgi:hypothetical protein